MNRIFLRFFPLVLLAIAAATFVIYFIFSRLYGDPLEEIARQQAAGQIFLLEQYIDQAPADEWLTRLNKVREVSNLSLELIPLELALADLPSSKQQRLQSGDIVLDVASKSFYRRVDLKGARYVDSEREVLRVRRLPIDVGQALRMEAIRFGTVALFLLLPMAWWSRLHWRGLQALSKVADNFGAGQFGSRARMAKSASLYPLADGMNRMADRIKQLLEARKNLLHAVSHELRTPIARMGFGLELLRSSADAASQEKRIQALERDLEELNTLVSELLSLNQLDQAPLQAVSDFSIAALLDNCVQGLTPLAQSKLVRTEIAADLGDMTGDMRLLSRAVNNLLGNALKYAQSQVLLSAQPLDAQNWQLRVEDDGPGVPEDQRQHIFEAFYRLKREQDHALGGYGLGLAIAHQAVGLNGGRIEVDASELGGARFTVTLPRG